MLQRYNNDLPRGEPLIQAKILTALANDIGAVIREHAALPRFRGMVLRWYADWSQLRDAELEFKEQCDKHARRVQADERLQDEAAGPPEDGWKFKAVVPPRDAKGWQVIGGWAPPDLAPEGFPEAPFPLPLPDCEITMPEKFAALAAVHDFAARGTTKIAPWAGSPDVVGGVAFRSLVDCVKNIPESDEPHLRAILDEIRCDLRACAASTGKSGGDVADQTTGGGGSGQVVSPDGDGRKQDRSRHPGFSMAQLRCITRLSSDTVNKYAKQVKVPTAERGKRNHRFTFGEAHTILEQIHSKSVEKRTRERCRAELDRMDHWEK